MIDDNTVPARPAPRGPELRAVIEEFGRVLDALGDQLAESVREAGLECVAVGRAFHELAAAKIRIDQLECAEPLKSQLHENSVQIGESLTAAVVALQYHDRLSQRIGHIHAGLNHLQKHLRDGAERSYEDWLVLLREVEQSHHAEQQRLRAAEIASNGTVDLF